MLLKEEGDFLVRATDNAARPIIVISLRDSSTVRHLTLSWKNNKWQLAVLKKTTSPSFSSVVELIAHYKEHKTPLKLRLKRAISRPHWHIKHDKVIFNKEKDLLGSGNFCHVYKGVYQKTAEEKVGVAVKIWHEEAGKQSDDAGREARNSMLSEAQIMSYYR